MPRMHENMRCRARHVVKTGWWRLHKARMYAGVQIDLGAEDDGAD